MDVGLIYPKSHFFIHIPESVVSISKLYQSAISHYRNKKFEEFGISRKISPASGFRILLSMAYIAKLLKNEGYNIKFFHQDYLESKRKNIEKYVKRISNCECIGIITSTSQYTEAIKLVNKIKELNQDCVICLMGREATFLDKKVIMDGVDVAIRGKGEFTFLNVVKEIEKENYNLKNIKNITWKRNDKTYRNKFKKEVEMTKLPPPDFSIFPFELRKNSNISLNISRGCPFNCKYCYESCFWGKPEFKTKEQIKNEIDLFLKYFPYDHIFFHDSTFNTNKELVKEVINILAEYDISFSCNIRTYTMDREWIKILKNSDCIGVFSGLENASARILRMLNRKEDFKKSFRVIKILNTFIPFVTISTIIGLPYETYSSAIDTVKMIEKLYNLGTFQVTTRVFTPYPGTPVFQNPKKYGIKILSFDFKRYDRYSFPPVYRLNTLNEFEIYSLFMLALGKIVECICKRSGFKAEEKLNDFIYINSKNILAQNIYKIDFNSTD